MGEYRYRGNDKPILTRFWQDRLFLSDSCAFCFYPRRKL